MYRSGLMELDAVVTVARLGGFRAAALELRVSATSISNAIAGLEKRLGVRLFHRTTRRVSLSTAGEQFIARVAPALTDIHDAMMATSGTDGRPAGKLRINSAVGAARQILVPTLLEYQRRFPEVAIDIVTDNRLIDIVARGFDAGIRTQGLEPADMVSVPFGGPLRYVVVGSPDYFRKHGVPKSPDELSSHRCIRAALPDGTVYQWEFSVRGRAVAVNAPGKLTLDEPALMREAALAGAGLAYLWEAHVADDLTYGRLASVLDAWTPTSPGFCLYHAARRQVPSALRALIEMLPATSVN